MPRSFLATTAAVVVPFRRRHLFTAANARPGTFVMVVCATTAAVFDAAITAAVAVLTGAGLRAPRGGLVESPGALDDDIHGGKHRR